jgi:hypothetical protein
MRSRPRCGGQAAQRPAAPSRADLAATRRADRDACRRSGATLTRRRGRRQADAAQAALQRDREAVAVRVGLYPMVTSQYSLTTLSQFSYHIR